MHYVLPACVFLYANKQKTGGLVPLSNDVQCAVFSTTLYFTKLYHIADSTKTTYFAICASFLQSIPQQYYSVDTQQFFSLT